MDRSVAAARAEEASTICGRSVPVPVRNREKDKERLYTSTTTIYVLYISVVVAQRS